eukprot:1180349-Prorocentrum_minimum.AAC.4
MESGMRTAFTYRAVTGTKADNAIIKFGLEETEGQQSGHGAMTHKLRDEQNSNVAPVSKLLERVLYGLHGSFCIVNKAALTQRNDEKQGVQLNQRRSQSPHFPAKPYQQKCEILFVRSAGFSLTRFTICKDTHSVYKTRGERVCKNLAAKWARASVVQTPVQHVHCHQRHPCAFCSLTGQGRTRVYDQEVGVPPNVHVAHAREQESRYSVLHPHVQKNFAISCFTLHELPNSQNVFTREARRSTRCAL